MMFKKGLYLKGGTPFLHPEIDKLTTIVNPDDFTIRQDEVKELRSFLENFKSGENASLYLIWSAIGVITVVAIISIGLEIFPDQAQHRYHDAQTRYRNAQSKLGQSRLGQLYRNAQSRLGQSGHNTSST